MPTSGPWGFFDCPSEVWHDLWALCSWVQWDVIAKKKKVLNWLSPQGSAETEQTGSFTSPPEGKYSHAKSKYAA